MTICSFPASTTGQYICEKINHEKRVDVDNKFALIKKYSSYSSTINLHCKKKNENNLTYNGIVEVIKDPKTKPPKNLLLFLLTC